MCIESLAFRNVFKLLFVAFGKSEVVKFKIILLCLFEKWIHHLNLTILTTLKIVVIPI